MKFLERAVLTSNFLDPVSTIISSIPAMDVISGNETLDIAFQKMVSSGYEEVGILDGGVLSFILHVDDIFEFLAKESVKSGGQKGRRDSLMMKDETDDGGILVETSKEMRRRIARQTKLSTLSPFQLSAQQFAAFIGPKFSS